MAGYSFGELVDIEVLQELLERFSKVLRIPAAILSPAGEILVGTGWMDICTKFHRCNPESEALCRKSDAYILKRTTKAPYIRYKCENNLWDVAVPITIAGEHLATFFVGQFFFEDEEKDRDLFRTQAARYGFDEAAYLDALDKVPIFPREQIDSILEYSTFLVGLLARMGQDRVGLLEMERSLRESEENLAVILESIGDAVIATDVQGRVIQMNAVAETLTKWPIAAAKGRPLTEIYRVLDAEDRTMLIARDGKELAISKNSSPIRGRGSEPLGVVLVFRDISADLLLQEQLRRSQRMETIGQLAGGIAHDFNNLLGGILGQTDLLVRELEPESRQSQRARTVAEAARRASELTAQLLAFSRRGKLQTVPFDVHGTVNEVVKLLEHTLDRKIEVVRHFEADHAVIKGDPSQFLNAILNLAINARDAMSEAGTLTFQTAVVPWTKSVLSTTGGEREKAALRLTVGDTGCGIDPGVLPHIFEPFFTTKSAGSGTGLGLAAVDGIVKNHGGALTVDSEPGVGSYFHITLPLSSEQAVCHEAFDSREVIHGHGCVLIVDDEEIIRTVAKEMLQQMGYETLEAFDGAEGLKVFQERSADIDVVMLDMIMPRMNGQETFSALRELNSNVRVLFSSGISDPLPSGTLEAPGRCRFLKKPFVMSELSSALASLLKD